MLNRRHGTAPFFFLFSIQHSHFSIDLTSVTEDRT